MVKDLYIVVSPISNTFNENCFGYNINASENKPCANGGTSLAKYWGKNKDGIYVLKKKIYKSLIFFDFEEFLGRFYSLKKSDDFLYKKAKDFAYSRNPFSITLSRPSFIDDAGLVVSVNEN